MTALPPNGQVGQPVNGGQSPQVARQVLPHPNLHPNRHPSQYPNQRPRSSVAAVVAVVLGAILTLGGLPFGLAVGALATVPKVFEMIEEVTEMTPSGTVTASRADDAFYLLAPEDAPNASLPIECTATTESGRSLPVQAVRPYSFSSEYRGGDFNSFAIVRAESPGEILIECPSDVVGVVAAPAFNAASFFAPLFWWSIGGVVATVMGVALVVVGIVLLVRRPRAVQG
ncbi:hypothetical protein ACF07D_14420 [Leucobacter sp. NPDC015123]|uniref:hypothetical protein n=1 Tax=Leucobacter sp. NPDC015123 TaxID=3364129 RepID=UPI0036F48C8D